MKTLAAFMKEGMKLKENSKREAIHGNFAGEKNTISGIFNTLSNMFPVDMACHLITISEIESEGNITNFLGANNTLNLEKLSSEESKRILHPRTMGLHSVLVEIPILHSIEFDALLDVSFKIQRNEVLYDHYSIQQIVKQGLLREKGREILEITSRGQALFELLRSFKKS
ncbi:MAG: hypothetical protein ACTSQS_05710 [Promethearchaeota archaeon]